MLSQKSFYSESCEEETKCNKDETGFDDFNNYLVEQSPEFYTQQQALEFNNGSFEFGNVSEE